MYRPRVIPVLLLKDHSLVKTVQFKKPNYLGDPINAVRIFNDLKADELVFLDIDASRNGTLIDLEFVKQVSEEANMPFAVGGGIRSIDDIRKVIASGAEKVIIGGKALEDPDFIRQAADTFGSSTIVVCIDVKKKLFGGNRVWRLNGTQAGNLDPIAFAKLMERQGAGELIVQSISHDGMMNGYDCDLIRSIAEKVTIPIVALGGAGKMEHLQEVYQKAFVNGLASGSFFVYQGAKKGVLISYPEREELNFGK